MCFVLWSGGFVGGARRCLHHNTLTAGGGNNVMFLTGEELLLLPPPSTLRVSPPSTSSCVLKEMEILFTQSTNTHICSLMLLFVDVRRSVGRSVCFVWSSSGGCEEEKKVTQPEKTRNQPLNTLCVSASRTGGRPPTVVCLLVIGVCHWFGSLFDDSSSFFSSCFFFLFFFWDFESQFKIVKSSFQNDPAIIFSSAKQAKKNKKKQPVLLFNTSWLCVAARLKTQTNRLLFPSFSSQVTPVGAKLSR